MTTWRRLLPLLAVLAALVVAAPAANAQDASGGQAAQDSGPQIVESWALAPAGSDDPSQPGNRPYLSYTAAAGTSVTDGVTIYNYGNVPQTFRLYAADAFNTEDGGFDVLAGDQTSKDVGAWVKIPQENLTLPPGQQATVPITIDIPADASPGDHVAAILASSRAEGTGPDGKAIALDRRTGTRLYLRVAGPVEPKLNIEGVSVSYSPSLNPLGGSATVTYTVANRGNVRLGGKSHVSVGGPFGLFSKNGPDQELTELRPGQSVTYTTTIDGVPATVVSSATVHLDPSAAAGDEDNLANESQGAMTLAVPWTILALLAVAFLVWYAVRAYRRHQGDGTRPSGPPGDRPDGPAQHARPLANQSA
jgi:hypothetical protein